MSRSIKRRRAAETGIRDFGLVSVANRTVFLENYVAELENTREIVLNTCKTLDSSKRADTTAAYLTKLAKVLRCGRLIGYHDGLPGERCEMCDLGKLCTFCHHAKSARRADLSANQLPKTRLPRVSHFVLTAPEPKNIDETHDYTYFIRLAKTKLVKYLGDVAVKSDDDSPKRWLPLHDYLIGVHTVPKNAEDCQWPHLHLLALTEDEPHVADRLEEDLRFQWNKWTYRALKQTTVMQSVFVGKKITRAKNVNKDQISVDHYRNLYAYVLRTTEEDDTPEVHVSRQQLFEKAGIKSTYSLPRIPGLERDINSPHEFHPERLDKDFIVLVPLTGESPVERDVSEYDEAKQQLEIDCLQFVYDALPGNVRTKLQSSGYTLETMS